MILAAFLELAVFSSAAAVHASPSVSRDVVSASISYNAPSSAKSLDPALVSFSIESDRWSDWSGISTPNQFFLNTLENLRGLSGTLPVIRVGANSEDKTTFDSTVAVVSAIFPPPTTIVPYPEAMSIRVSDAYYALVNNMPEGTHMIWGVNFGSGNTANAAAMTQSIINAFASSAVKNKGIVLDSIEIGNEADLYRYNGLRSPSWDINQYFGQWLTYVTAVVNAAKLKKGSPGPSILLASFANSDFGKGDFSPEMLFQQGVLSGPFGPFIHTVSQHHYSGSFCTGSGGLLQNLMAKSGVRSNVSEFDPDIAATNARGLDYIFGETNSYACHGAPGVSNTAGAALWTLDYALQSATRNIRRVHFHVGIGFKYALVQPITLTRSTLDAVPLPSPLPPHVQPQYYAAIIVASLISKGSAVRISEISISDSRIAGYAAYDKNGALTRAVFINSVAYLSTTTMPRGVVHLDLCINQGIIPCQTSDTMMRVRRLSIRYADDTAGLTFAGQSYETPSGLVSGQETVESVPVLLGLLIEDTEAVLVEFF